MHAYYTLANSLVLAEVSAAAALVEGPANGLVQAIAEEPADALAEESAEALVEAPVPLGGDSEGTLYWNSNTPLLSTKSKHNREVLYYLSVPSVFISEITCFAADQLSILSG